MLPRTIFRRPVPTILGIVLCLQFNHAVLAQIALQRLAPDSTIRQATFGKRVDISGDNVFVYNGRDAIGADCCRGSVSIYSNDGSSWNRSQRLFPDVDSSPYGFRDFAVAGDFLVAVDSSVHLYQRVGGLWQDRPPLAPRASAFTRVSSMNEDYVVVWSKPANSSLPTLDALQVFERNGNDWADAGRPPYYGRPICLADAEILQLADIGGQGSLLVTSRTSDGWAVSDTVNLGAKYKGYLPIACRDDGNRVVVSRSSSALIIDRNAESKWSVTEEIDLSKWSTTIMDVKIHGDYIYIGQETRVDLPGSRHGAAYRSELLVLSNRFGSWDLVRSIQPLVPFDPSWEYNDGCIGASIAANDEYIVAGAPSRYGRVDGAEFDDVGEVYIIAMGLVDRRPAPAAVPERFELSWSSVYPSPGRGQTTLQYTLPVKATVSAEVFDIVGRRVKILTRGTMDDGPHSTSFDTSSWASGVYFLRMELANRVPSVQTFIVE